MPLPYDVSPVPASPVHMPGSTTPLPEVDADAAARDQEINTRRAAVENPETLRLARSL